jgi:hypothetical protein
MYVCGYVFRRTELTGLETQDLITLTEIFQVISSAHKLIGRNHLMEVAIDNVIYVYKLPMDRLL